MECKTSRKKQDTPSTTPDLLLEPFGFGASKGESNAIAVVRQPPQPAPCVAVRRIAPHESVPRLRHPVVSFGEHHGCCRPRRIGGSTWVEIERAECVDEPRRRQPDIGFTPVRSL